MRRLNKFLTHSWRDRLLLLEALVWLSLAKVLLRLVPFRCIAPLLGRQMAQTASEITTDERQLALNISWAVQAVARHAPLGFVCLPQAMAAKWMLRRRRLASTLYLGLCVPKQRTLTAHAWLRVGDRILTGREQSRTHHAIATFAE